MENRNFMTLTDDELYEVNGGGGNHEVVTTKIEINVKFSIKG